MTREREHKGSGLGLIHEVFNLQNVDSPERRYFLKYGLVLQEGVDPNLTGHFFSDFLAAEHGENQEIVNKFVSDEDNLYNQP